MPDAAKISGAATRWPVPAVAAGVAIGVIAVSFSAILIRVAGARRWTARSAVRS